MAWYSDESNEEFVALNRMFGPYWPVWWTTMTCNILIPQALWWRSVRTNPALLFCISILVNVGMWAERYMIVVVSLHRDFLPSSWGKFHGTIWDWSTFLGTIGLFFTLLFLFVRLLPMIPIAELRKQTVEDETK
jgi:molybdopterin-containing oxidoreductase family membrane subunit